MLRPGAPEEITIKDLFVIIERILFNLVPAIVLVCYGLIVIGISIFFIILLKITKKDLIEK